jgi:two-component system, sensor histidine kinase and response regulator
VTRPPKILVVDDQPVNITLMQKKLESEKMTVLCARNGFEALEIVAAEPPDLILLDVMMPGMDGLEVCHRLKSSEETRSIPIIFLTARDSREGMFEGLAAGAADYITKPVDLDEAVARVRAQLHYHEIFKQNIELTQRLAEARRAATMGALSQGISHNLNNLLGVIFGYLELAKNNVGKPEVIRKHLDKIDEAVNRMTRMIRQVTTVSNRMHVALGRIDSGKLLDGAITRFRNEQKYPIKFEVHNSTHETVVMANPEVFEDAVEKLLFNAWESYGGKPAGEVEITIESRVANRDGRAVVEFSISDRGNGLDAKVRDHVFEPFVSTKSTVGVGMGLTIARHGIRNLGGEIQLTDRPGGGTTATFHLPLATAVTATAA